MKKRKRLKKGQFIFVSILFAMLVCVIIAGQIHDKDVAKANAKITNEFNKSPLATKTTEKNNQSNQKFQGKIWNAIGDSITFRDGYEPIVKDSLGLKSYRNYGKSGFTTEMLLEDMNKWDSNADLITFFAGTNDFGRDLDLSVTKASTEKIFSYLKEKYPNKTIIVILPTQRWGYTGDVLPEKTMTNRKGLTLRQYCDTIAEIAKKYNLKVIDMFNDSGINQSNINQLTIDGLHPNDAGYQKIADVIINYLQKL